MTKEEQSYWRIKDTLDEFYAEAQQEDLEEATTQLLADLYYFVARQGLDKAHIKDSAELRWIP